MSVGGCALIPGRLWATGEAINHLHLDCVLTHNIDKLLPDSDIGRAKQKDRRGPEI